MDAARRSALARRPSRRRRVSVLLTLTFLTAACTTAEGHSGTSAATDRTPPPTSGAQLSTSSGAPSSAPGPPMSISAVGDIIMGSTPQLPPDDGRHLFDGVAGQVPGTVALANMDQTLTDDAAFSKCGATSSDCYAFRTRPRHHRRRVINDHPGRSTRPFPTLPRPCTNPPSGLRGQESSYATPQKARQTKASVPIGSLQEKSIRPAARAAEMLRPRHLPATDHAVPAVE